jgi:pyruvate dehydrogenase E1 component beta subunit
MVAKLLVPEGTEGVKVNTPIATLSGDDDVAGREGDSCSATAACKAIRRPRPRLSRPRLLERPERVATGVQMHTITVREALREAMAEEMRRDPNVFLMGEEVGAVPGRLQGQPGAA